MREIKFRAWDKKQDLMYEVDFYSLDGGTQPVFSDKGWMGPLGHPFDSDDSFLMQYTGLKDKNGREIYEGDIVGWHVTNPFGDDVLCRHPIEFRDMNDDSMLFKGKGWMVYSEQPVEVIGNIYENPELLK